MMYLESVVVHEASNDINLRNGQWDKGRETGEPLRDQSPARHLVSLGKDK